MTQLDAYSRYMAHTETASRSDTPGQLLRKLRQDSGVHGRQLAAAIGVTASHLRSIENGHRNLTPENRARICKYLKIPLESLPATREITQVAS